MPLKIALLCGGPSLERGISLNSARSVLDHLQGEDVDITPVYFDHKKQAYKVSRSQLYSNTPSDFDFKLQDAATKLTKDSLLKVLKGVDLVFPVMHGTFGEDGGIQSFLEKHDIPFIGSTADACKRAFDKYNANKRIAKAGFFTLPSTVLKIYGDDHANVVSSFFKEHAVTRAVVKPASGGSSIGVFSVSKPEEALEKAELIFSKRMDTRVVIEPFAQGREFTVIILQNQYGLPVAILPTEIETDYDKHQIFDFRKKYLPTRHVTYHCPPRFDDQVIEKIQVQAEHLFSLLGMRDFARFDGWVLEDGNIWFSDFNPISGMEQNSFLFQQSSRVGLSHAHALRYIVSNAAKRHGLPFAWQMPQNSDKKRKPVSVLFGGTTSERQVSLMSGTNVWLKLRTSCSYKPTPYMLAGDDEIWELPYAYALNHTVEEIAENCEHAEETHARLRSLVERVHLRLGLKEHEGEEYLKLPRKLSMSQLLQESDFVFIALHGGIGENGTLQELFEKHAIRYNGPGATASRICMDKWRTGEEITKLRVKGVLTAPKHPLSTKDLLEMSKDQLADFWVITCRNLKAKTLIIKPKDDGCSSGIVRLFTADDLQAYRDLLKDKAHVIPAGTFRGQEEPVEMGFSAEFLLERFIKTDSIRVKGNALKYTAVSGWTEVTVGVYQHGDSLVVMNPSITIAEGEVLSLEEKFQGGTGINITPPPSSIISPKALQRFRGLIGKVAEGLGIEGYSRIDAFVNCESGDAMVIEINTLPGLTPSTVLYHQALAEKPALYPQKFLELLIQNKGY
jgi:D-alanine--D-alanine ligase